MEEEEYRPKEVNVGGDMGRFEYKRAIFENKEADNVPERRTVDKEMTNSPLWEGGQTLLLAATD